MASAPRTLYINNINEKIKKNVLKKVLYMTFSQYGRISEIICCKGIKLRGQAWIVFHDSTSAANAMRGKQNFTFYDKPLRIAFAKTKSNIVAKQDGTYVHRAAKRARDDEESEDEPAAKLTNTGEK